MEDVHVIRQTEQLKGLSDPLRLAIVKQLMRTPMSTAQLAHALDEKPTKLHYHVSELERVGLIEVAETRERGNLRERLYRPVAAYFRVDPALFRESTEAASAFLQSAQSALEEATADLARLMADQESAIANDVLSLHLELQLSAQDWADFQRRLRELIDTFREREDPEVPPIGRVTLVAYPTPPSDGTDPNDEMSD